jgi:pSer/pThr/pTyr-binding forkhead associated (FHA) protein
MDVNLVMFRGDGEKRSFKLPRDVTLVGRREDCDLRIPLSEISRKHCRLIKEADSLRLEDLGSSNGTFHNGQRIQESIIAPGDSIQVGPIVFVAQIDGQPPQEQLHPVIAVGEEGTEQTTEVGGLVPTAQSEVDNQAEYDPMDALTTEPEESNYGFVIDDEHPPKEDESVQIDLDQTQPGRER